MTNTCHSCREVNALFTSRDLTGKSSNPMSLQSHWPHVSSIYFCKFATHRNLLDWQHVQICNSFINNSRGLHNFHMLCSHLTLSLPCPVLSAVTFSSL